MKILVIGSNGREHALAEAYAKSKKTKKVFIAPGNGLSDFTNKKITNVDISMLNFSKLLEFAKKEKVDLVDVAQDDIIAQGYVDKFQKEKVVAFGPTQKASQIEWDKEWARNFMQKYKLPIPHFKSFSSQKDALLYINGLPDQLLFIKASGLALGKGVIRAENNEDAIAAIGAISQFGKAAEIFLVEEGLIGEEFSLFALCDGKNFKIISVAQDHKTAFEKDSGPNTGGMGSIAKALIGTTQLIKEVEKKILTPFLRGMEKENRPYSGILYVGGMLTKNGIKVIEFNSRWGDPEAEVILPSIQTDYVDIVFSVLKKRLKKQKITIDKKVRISIAACSQGYPTDYSKAKGKEIFGIQTAVKLPGVTLFGSGIVKNKKRFFVNGGRLFYIVTEGKNIIEARQKAYSAMSHIFIEENNLHFRTDIGWRDVQRLNKKI